MLYSVVSNEPVKRIPHRKQFELWRSRLSEDEFAAIEAELNSMIDGDEVHTSSWMPGSDWTDTPFHPIYEKACLRDESEAAKFFGLALWKVMMDRPEAWAFGRYAKDGVPIEGMTYFRVAI